MSLKITSRSVHLCVDMQRLFSSDGPWPTPWMERVLPHAVTLVERFPDRTVFIRFMPPQRPDDMWGAWRTTLAPPLMPKPVAAVLPRSCQGRTAGCLSARAPSVLSLRLRITPLDQAAQAPWDNA